MLRYQVFLSYAFLWAAIWYQALQSEDTIVDKSPLSPEATKLLIQLLPLWILVALAIYALTSILYGLATLGDFPEAAVELEKEIREAKAAMKKRGIPVVE
jgi:amino acid transporter